MERNPQRANYTAYGDWYVTKSAKQKGLSDFERRKESLLEKNLDFSRDLDLLVCNKFVEDRLFMLIRAHLHHLT